MGAVCVTYCVGGLSLCNSIAGAYAEKSPVVVISGSPGLGERINNPLLHHKVRDFHTQADVFEKICVAGAELDDPHEAFREIDRVLDAAARYKRPVYFGIAARHGQRRAGRSRINSGKPTRRAIPKRSAEAVDEAVRWINSCQKAVIIAGVEIHRFGLQDEVLALAEGSNIAIAATMLGKSVVSEVHPLYVGLYEGALGREEVTAIRRRQRLRDSAGHVHDRHQPRHLHGQSRPGEVHLRHQRAVADPAPSLPRRAVGRFHPSAGGPATAARRAETAAADRAQRARSSSFAPDAPVTISRLIARLNELLNDETVVIADIGDALFAATELIVRERTEFISPAYYTSMGFAVPAALGVHVARPDRRAVVIVGDGAFQMTGHGALDARPAQVSDHHHPARQRRLRHRAIFAPAIATSTTCSRGIITNCPRCSAAARGYEIRTEGEFDAALRSAWADTSGPSLLQVKIGPHDISTALNRLAERLSKKV